jgi:hypothetical protein
MPGSAGEKICEKLQVFTGCPVQAGGGTAQKQTGPHKAGLKLQVFAG